MRLAANLTYLFTELPMMERFPAAAAMGFEGVEIPFPYDLSARDLGQAAHAAGLEFVAMAAPPPNWAGGPRGFAAQPGGEGRFRNDFMRALRYGEVLRARHIQVIPGLGTGPEAHATLIANLDWAVRRAPHASILIEPVSSRDLPGAYLDDLDLAVDCIRQIGAPNLGLQFDIWHLHAITGDVLAAWERAAPLVRHVQISGWPGRAEPLPGSAIDYAALLARMRKSGYAGWIAAEYAPARGTRAGLGWMRQLSLQST